MYCKRCDGELEPVNRAGTFLFNFCRPCKIPYDDQGRPSFDLSALNSAFNPLKSVRGIINKAQPSASPLAKTALEVMLMQGMLDAYFSGIKDGVLLAYSQDTTKDGGSVDERERHLQAGARDVSGDARRHGESARTRGTKGPGRGPAG